MRPLLGDRPFPGLPKFLWFDNGSSGDGSSGSGGDASGSSGTAAATGDAATAAGIAGQAAAAGYGFGSGMGTGGAPAGTSTTGTGGFGSFGGGGSTGFGGGSATGTSVGMGPGSAASGSGGGAGTAGGGTTSGGGGTTGGGAATGPGAATGGAATGGGGGTAAGGSSASPGLTADVIAQLNAAFGASPGNALRGAVNLSQLDFGSGGATTGVPSFGVPEGVGGQGAAPVGQVSTSALGPAGYSSNAISSLNSQLAALARSAGQTFGTSLGNAGTTDQVSPPGQRRGGVPAYQGVPATTMGYPAAGLATTPSGTVAPSGNAPNGSTVGQATINAPPTNPDAPAVGSHNAGGDQGLSGLASAASTAVNQSNPSVTGGATSAPTSPTSPNAPIGGGDILQTIMSLVMSYPPLLQLAQSALTGSPNANRPQNVLSGGA